MLEFLMWKGACCVHVWREQVDVRFSVLLFEQPSLLS